MFLYTRNNSPKFYFRPFNARCHWANSKQFVISNLFKNSVYFRIWANSIRTKTICKCRKAKTRGEKNYVYRICLQATNVKSKKIDIQRILLKPQYLFSTILRAYVDRVVSCRLDSLKVHQRSQLQILHG